MDSVVSKIRKTALELAMAVPCQFFLGKKTETGEFNIDFSARAFSGKANIKISHLNGGYVSVVVLRVTGAESEYFWDYRFFDKKGNHLTRKTKFI
ncbi:MAG: hypothetical protein Q8Q95_00425 [bacterium]|nr:hypothetical protein [bacterium]